VLKKCRTCGKALSNGAQLKHPSKGNCRFDLIECAWDKEIVASVKRLKWELATGKD